ncbi:MAG: hypothetical protein KA099_11705 [Alphaproteobacteria bacterium]|nr:hypothetical protein [Alphaproteobacteria bacterium]MBP7760039.1 hypothetical protein [Alphaproteobacteria bacterium]MBP7763390.1 hypothetical protein [Alphaproteobacteria bacterium]MBP7905977.1 hypothetical protein [Alphaproteobacteria bacterium]
MSRRLYPHNRVRYWYAYELEEICALFSDKGLHIQTVRKWISKGGLKTVGAGKPALVFGHNLITFLKRHNSRNKCKTVFREFYCVKCHDSRPIYQNKVRVVHEGKYIKLCGLCRSCKTLMFKSYKLADYPAIKRTFCVVDVLELYDCSDSTDKTHIHVEELKRPSESVQGELFHV